MKRFRVSPTGLEQVGANICKLKQVTSEFKLSRLGPAKLEHVGGSLSEFKLVGKRIEVIRN